MPAGIGARFNLWVRRVCAPVSTWPEYALSAVPRRLSMRKSIRRVVTGHDAAGRSVFITDAPAPHVYNRASGSAVVTELWETRAMPADNSGNDEVTDHPFRLAPPRNGSVFRIVEYPPDKERVPALASEASGQRGNSIVRAHRASDDARERADDTRPE